MRRVKLRLPRKLALKDSCLFPCCFESCAKVHSTQIDQYAILTLGKYSLDTDFDYSQYKSMDSLIASRQNGRPASAANADRTRAQFRKWLRDHRRQAADMSLSRLVRCFNSPISLSAAYRVALAAGLRGKRRNRTRYEQFWSLIDWSLPDSVLSDVWGVKRGNLRQRRVRLGIDAPRFNVLRDFRSAQFVKAVSDERRRAAEYAGPRPR
jgi:hypothetical protein